MSEKMVDVYTRNFNIWDDEAMAAAISQNIPVDHIQQIDFGYSFIQNGNTAPTLADVKGDFIDELVLTLAGNEICRLDWYDVCILQNLWFGQTPHHLLPAADDQYGYFSPVTLPLYLDKVKRSLRVQLTVGALTDVDGLLISAGAKYRSNLNISIPPVLPGGYHYAYQYKTFIAQTTRQDVIMDRAGADLVGLLLYSCTIPIATSLNTSIDSISVLCNGQVVYETKKWLEMPTFKTTQNVLDDATYGAELDNYRYLDFTIAPLPADDLVVRTVSQGATDAGQKIIGIYIEP